MPTVKSTEFQNKFGEFKDLAQQEPVTITSHGRATLVLLSSREYDRLKRRDREALRVEDLSAEDIKAIIDSEPPEKTKQFDHELDG